MKPIAPTENSGVGELQMLHQSSIPYPMSFIFSCFIVDGKSFSLSLRNEAVPQINAVTLVDLGQGNVRPASQISVGVDEWGWSRGTCMIASTSSTDWFSELRLTMINNEQWREAMRVQGFVFDKTT